ncbi:MAG: DUF928 domain-containing protein [Cyanobacteria bacterium P01_B01_bin.77]
MKRQLYTLGLIALQYGCVSMLARPASAQISPSLAKIKQSNVLPIVFNNDNAPNGFDSQGRPRSRTSGGSRGTCSELVVALLPGSDTLTSTDAVTECNTASTSHLAATLETNPTLWFHIPAPVAADTTAELVLLDNNQQVLSSNVVTLPAKGGIIGLRLDYPLETGAIYSWIFSVLNQPNSPSQNPTVEGRLQRIAAHPELSDALATQDTPSQIRALAHHGIWHDALHELALLYREDSSNVEIQTHWFALLDSVGLESIAQEPLADCCFKN